MRKTALEEFSRAFNAGAEITGGGASLLPFPGPNGDGFFGLLSCGSGTGGHGRLRRSGRLGRVFLMPLWNPTLFPGDDQEHDEEEQAHQQAGENQQQAIEVQAKPGEKIGGQTGGRKDQDKQTDSHQPENALFFRHRKACLNPFFLLYVQQPR